MTKPDETWLRKDDAAKAIGVSTKWLEKMAKEGQVRMGMYRRPTGGPQLSVYHPGDVERVRAEREDGSAVARIEPQKLEKFQKFSEFQNFAKFLGSAEVKAAIAHMSLREKTYLTIDEARTLTGLPAQTIRHAARDGEVKKRGRLYRRADLSSL